MTLSAPAALPFAFPGVAGVRCLFSTIHAGDMMLRPGREKAGLANRRRFMAAAGFARWAETRQVHGDAIVAGRGRPEPDGADLADADGMFTFDKGMGLAVKTADCQPLLFARDDGGAVAALHMGWRGNARGLPATAVRRLCEAFGCGPERLVAVRGPSLGPSAAEFVNFEQEWPGEFSPWLHAETRTVNLWALTRRQLTDAGVPEERIYSLDCCTRDMPDLFYSHRRGDAGRMVNAIWRES